MDIISECQNYQPLLAVTPVIKRKLAVDFGNASTLLGVWDEPTKRAVMLELPPYSHVYAMEGPDSDTFITPSIIHYHNRTDFLVGCQVLEHAARGGVVNPMSQLKSRFIKYKIQSGVVDNQTAATNFLSTVLLAAKKLAGLDDSSEIILTNPVAAFEDYKLWLQDLSRSCGFRNIRLLDEPVAAALTLVDQVDDGDVFLVFDYGAYTLDLALVRFTKHDRNNVCERIGAEVLEDMAGDAIDSWLTKYVMEQHADSFQGFDPLKVTFSFKKQCKFAKQILSRASRTTVEVPLPAGPSIRFELTRADLRSVLDSKKLLEKIRTKVLDLFSKSNSVDIADVRGALLVGGSSYLPPVQAVLKEIFGNEKVFAQSPIQAVVHGATLYASGAQIFDHIQNFYAFKYMDLHGQRFKSVVKPYTDYPYDGKEPIVIHAVKPKQSEFNLYFYEFNSDPSNIKIAVGDSHPLDSNCLNDDAPVNVKLPHAVHKGDPAFEARFAINADKHLVVNAYAYDKHGKPTIELLDNLVIVQLAKKENVSVPRIVADLVEGSVEEQHEKPSLPNVPMEKDEVQSKSTKQKAPEVKVQQDRDVDRALKILIPKPPNLPAEPSSSEAADPDTVLKKRLLPYRNSFEASLTALAILQHRKHREHSHKITLLCDVLHKDARVINDGIFWKLRDVVSTLHGANHSKKLDRNMARWVDVIIEPVDSWLINWADSCKRTGALSNKDWTISDKLIPKSLLALGVQLDDKIEAVSMLHQYSDLSIEQQIVYLQNDDIFCVKLADEIKEVRRYCRKISDGHSLKPRELENSQWHLIALPALIDWLNKAAFGNVRY